MPGILDLMGHVQDQYKQGQETGRRRSLSGLMQQAMSAPRDQRQGLIGQMAGVDPDAALTAQGHFDKMDDTARTRLGQYAAAFLALPPDQKAMAYPDFARQAQQLGIPAPLNYSPEYDKGLAQVAQAFGGGGNGNTVQSRFVGEDGMVYSLMRDGSLQSTGIKADRQMWFRDHPGMAPELVGKDGMIRQVGAPQQQPGMTQVQYATDDGQPIPPNEQAAFQQAMRLSAAGQEFDIPVGGPRQATIAPAQARPSEAQVAAEQEAAKQAAQIQALPTRLGIETQDAITRARGTAEAQADVERAGKTREKQAAYDQYVAAMRGVETGLENTTTNPVAGLFPAVTANQQIAEGAVAASAPVLKQLFRSAGEGVFTDKDQELLIAMLPTRKDHPAARKAKLENIDAIVRAKLGIGPDSRGDPGPPNDIRSMSDDALLRALGQ